MHRELEAIAELLIEARERLEKLQLPPRLGTAEVHASMSRAHGLLARLRHDFLRPPSQTAAAGR